MSSPTLTIASAKSGGYGVAGTSSRILYRLRLGTDSTLFLALIASSPPLVPGRLSVWSALPAPGVNAMSAIHERSGVVTLGNMPCKLGTTISPICDVCRRSSMLNVMGPLGECYHVRSLASRASSLPSMGVRNTSALSACTRYPRSSPDSRGHIVMVSNNCLGVSPAARALFLRIEREGILWQ
ncbi:hypothetical protein OH76DRAFT_655898 [Lentinus brumalis]|uniref:Uncharacterized protein n=1 Tax=Lentinus brumalis TaxID=2498619 RepID=A0A371D7H4_9APHY|nr:hypothetical protein OH76DRAFT_655898 [Polyporus brumalis]